MPIDESSNPSGLAPVSHGNNKPAKARKSSSKKTAQQPSDANLMSYVQSVGQEVEQVDGVYREAVQGYAHHKADELVEAIAEMPTMFYERLAENLGSLEVDRESFRQAREDIKRMFEGLGVK